MRKMTSGIMAAGIISAIAISNIFGIVSDGKRLDELRHSVLRLHILANSDSEEDQRLKLMVRNELLEHSGELFGDAGTFEQAEENISGNLDNVCAIAEELLSENGCDCKVKAEITEMYFDERQYGDLTMPEGEYTALRIEIGEAEGRNWWCVMYPQLCIPAACAETIESDTDEAEDFFSDEEYDILRNPKKYRVKFAVWEKIRYVFDF